ncbi:protein of unknown function [Clostridium beijerinckii]|nr:protein of unknown function [Clostridium beijerinckii]
MTFFDEKSRIYNSCVGIGYFKYPIFFWRKTVIGLHLYVNNFYRNLFIIIVIIY